MSEFNHEEFDKYVEGQVDSVLNIVSVIRFLAKEALTVAELSKRINSEDKRQKYDLYALTSKMIKWGYIQKEQNAKKYKSTLDYCELTEKGQDLLAHIPEYIAYLKCITYLDKQNILGV